MDKKAYVNGGDVKHIDLPELTLAAQFNKTVSEFGNEKIYFYDSDGNTSEYTYASIKSQALKILKGLHKCGIKEKDMIIFQSSNSEDFTKLFWACMYGGIIPVLANLPKALNDEKAADCQTVYNIWKLLDNTQIIVSGDVYDDYSSFADKLNIDSSLLTKISDLEENEESIDEIYHTDPDDIAMMFFTSGSTGMPKGVIQTNKAVLTRCYGDSQFFELKKEVLLNWMPLEHAGGVLMAHFRGVIFGSTQILVDTGYILSNPIHWLDLIDKYRVNYSWAPHFAYVLINEALESYEGNWDLSCVTHLLDGGEMVHAKSGKQFLSTLKKYGMNTGVIYPAWGMCETCSGTMYEKDFDEDEYSGTECVAKDMSNGVIASEGEAFDIITRIGEPIPGCEIKVVDYNNEILNECEIGRFLIRGEAVTKGYYKNDDANQQSFTEDGWFITGDLGFIYNGRMTLTGREKDIIIVNGLNYNNVEIEAVIEENTEVEKSFSAVCSVIDPETQKALIIAFVVPKSGIKTNKLISDVKNAVNDKIMLNINYVIPVTKEDIPKTNLGKIQRAKLGKRFTNKEFDELLEDVNVENKEIEVIEKQISADTDISRLAIFKESNVSKQRVVFVSSILISDKLYEGSRTSFDFNVNSDIIDELKKIDGVKNIRTGTSDSKLLVFFETGFDNVEYNASIARCIEKVLKKNSDGINVRYIPLTNDAINAKSVAELEKLYQQGEFTDITEKIECCIGSDRTLPQWFFTEELEEISIDSNSEIPDGKYIIFCNRKDVIERLNSNGTVYPENSIIITENSELLNDDRYKTEYIDINDKASYEKIVNGKYDEDSEAVILHLFGLDDAGFDVNEAESKIVLSIQNTIQAFEKNNIKINKFVVITTDALMLGNKCNKNYLYSIADGYCTAAVDEGYNVSYIDIDKASENNIHSIIRNELCENTLYKIIYRNGGRYRAVLINADVNNIRNENAVVYGGLYAITGGLGGIAEKIAEILIDKFNAKVLLLGRKSVSELSKEKIEILEKLNNNSNGNVEYYSCDITSFADFEKIINEGTKKYSHELDGIIHLSGTVTEKMIAVQNKEDIDAIYASKVYGTNVIAEYVKKNKNTTLVLTSSARTLSPGITVSAYCSASTFNANVAGYLRNQYDIDAICLSWSQWDEIGMSRDIPIKKVLQDKGFDNISGIRGQNSFVAALHMDVTYLYVGLDPSKSVIDSLSKEHSEVDTYTVYVESEAINGKESLFESRVNELLDKKNVIFHVLKMLPLDKNGKVDKVILKSRKAVLTGEVELVKPRNEVEETISNCWKKIFNNVEFGVTDSFFELGGDSIRMIRLISLLKSAFNIQIKNQEIFKLITIEEQAKYICEKTGNVPEVSVDSKETINNENTDNGENKSVPENYGILSSAQKRQWFLYKLDPECPNYNNTIALSVEGMIVIPCIKMALYQLIERHDILRTKYCEYDQACYQVVDKDAILNIDEIDLSRLAAEELEAELKMLYAKEANTVIKIDVDIPIRAKIIRCSANKIILLMSIHHIASDGWSMRVLLQDLSEIYSDIIKYGRSRKSELKIQYMDYAEKQHDFMKSDEYRRQLAYWKEELVDAPPALKIFDDVISETYNDNEGKRLYFEINEQLSEKIKQLCSKKNCTLYMFMLSAFAVMLQRYSNQNDMVLGTLIANRNKEELESMIGFFVNSLPLRLNVDPDSKFNELLECVKNKTLNMYDNQDVQFDALVDELNIGRTAGKNPLFQIIFVVQNAQIEEMDDENAHWGMKILDSETSKFDLIIQIFEIDGKLSVKLEYNLNCFAEDSMERFGKNYIETINSIVNEPDSVIGDFDIVNETERDMILSINDNKTDYASDTNIYSLFKKVCEAYTMEKAISIGNEKMNYKELDERSGAIAEYLKKNGVMKGDIVAVMADKTPQIIVSLLSLLRLGAVYLPISQKYPIDFIEKIISDSKTRFLLFHGECDISADIQKINIDLADSNTSATVNEEVAPEDPAYVIYTSGSTGVPKGVTVTHRNIIRLIDNTNFIDIKKTDIILQTGSITFDASTFEIWGALLNGAELHLVSEDILLDSAALKKEIIDSKASILWVSAPLFHQLVDIDSSIFNSVRVLLAGGDVVKPEYTNRVFQNNPSITIINGYGPTENTTFSTTYNIKKTDTNTLPIGTPIANSTAYIVNSHMKLQPIGAAGELVVGGDGISIGYLNNPELTAKCFVDDIFTKEGKLYHTGDFARMNRECVIDFLGRIDNQVKIRGFRIELGSIECAIDDIKGVKNSIVIAVNENNGKKIAAYYVSDTELDIIGELEKTLPHYMLPDYVIRIEQIPLNKNGKVDFKRLPKHNSDGIRQHIANKELPKNKLEEELVDIWKQLLKIDDLGVTDNFFKLGGDSILVIQLTNMIKKQGYDVSTKMIFKYQTIRDIVEHLKKNEGKSFGKETVRGKVNLNPIQTWFFDQNFKNKNYWNLPLMLNIDSGYTAEMIEKSLKAVIKHHDALHSRFTFENGVYMHEYSDEINNVEFTFVNVDDLIAADKIIRDYCIEAQKKIDITNGIMLSAVAFKDSTNQKLFIAVHHLVSDGISLRVIADDIKNVLRDVSKGKEVEIEDKTLSFMEWNRSIESFSASEKIMKQAEYWQNVNRSIDNSFINIDGLENKESDCLTVSREIDGDRIKKLLHDGIEKLGAAPNELFLTALYCTFNQNFGIEKVAVRLEGHGREDIINSEDVSRTVGWFTSAYPVILASNDSDDLVDNVLSIKDSIKRIPNKGIAYGILKYMRSDIKLEKEPVISFNYLGEFDDDIEIGEHRYGEFRDADAERDIYIDFNLMFIKGKFVVSITVNSKLNEDNRISSIADIYVDNINKLIDVCDKQKERIYSPSDFDGCNLSSDELKNIIDKYENVKDIYPLTDSQKGMLFHYTVDPDSEDYFGQIHCPLNGKIDKDLFERAWRDVVRNNPVLSTVYVYENIDEPVQVVCDTDKTSSFSVCKIKDGMTDNEFIEKFLKEDREKNFVLDQFPLSRVVIAELEDHDEFILSFPHISLDGWSIFIILRELIENYCSLVTEGKTCQFENKGDLKEFINYQRKLDYTEAEKYWKEYLTDFIEKNEIWGIAVENDDIGSFVQKNISLSKKETDDLNEKAKINGVTVNVLLQCALAMCITKFSGNKDVVFGTTVSGRNCELDNINSITGLLINTLPVRINLGKHNDIPSLLTSIQNDIFARRDHEYVSLAKIKTICKADSNHELFDILYIFENYPVDKVLKENAAGISMGDFSSHERTNYAVTIVAVPGEETLIRFSYMNGLVEESVLEAFMSDFKKILLKLCSAETVDNAIMDTPELIDKIVNEWSINADVVTVYEDQNEIYEAVSNPDKDVRIFLLDENQVPVSVGIPGEVYLAVNNFDLIESDWTDWMDENKIENPLSINGEFKYLYKTGDYGIWNNNKALQLID